MNLQSSNAPQFSLPFVHFNNNHQVHIQFILMAAKMEMLPTGNPPISASYSPKP